MNCQTAVFEYHPIHADRITPFAFGIVITAGLPAMPSTSTFSRSPMLMSPCRAAWA